MQIVCMAQGRLLSISMGDVLGCCICVGDGDIVLVIYQKYIVFGSCNCPTYPIR